MPKNVDRLYARMDVYFVPNGECLTFSRANGGYGYFAEYASTKTQYSEPLEYIGTFDGMLEVADGGFGGGVFSWIDEEGKEHKAHA